MEQLCLSPDSLKLSWAGYNAPKDKERRRLSVSQRPSLTTGECHLL